MDLPGAIRKNLLDPSIWQEGLKRFATATNLAVLLTDTEGRALGNCINSRPTWSLLGQNNTINIEGCPFCIEATKNGVNCVTIALERAASITTTDAAGLVHLAIPLVLFDQPVGGLITGQVFDRYPDHLRLHNVARKFGLSSERVLQSARLEFPVRRETLQVYGRLLETFGRAFLQARYQILTDAERLAEMTRLRDLGAQLAMEQRELAVQREQQIELNAKILEETRNELNFVTGRLVSAHEEERERIARELHDNIGQSIVALLFDLHELKKRIPIKSRHQVAAQLDAINNRVRQITDEVRQLSHELHPAVLTDLGLEEAVRQLGEKMGKHGIFAVTFAARDVPAVIEPTVSLGIYRIIQEALQNIIRHAGPCTVTIALTGMPACLDVCITDTGKGFEVSKARPGLGLNNMAHRAELLGGRFELESHVGQGTKVCVHVPFHPDK